MNGVLNGGVGTLWLTWWLWTPAAQDMSLLIALFCAVAWAFTGILKVVMQVIRQNLT